MIIEREWHKCTQKCSEKHSVTYGKECLQCVSGTEVLNARNVVPAALNMIVDYFPCSPATKADVSWRLLTPNSYVFFETSISTYHIARCPTPRNKNVIIIIIIIIIIYLSWSWATCWPVPVSRIQKSLQRSTMIPSASWTVVFHYPG